MAYNGRRQGPGQLWAAWAGRAAKKNGWARARPGLEKERLGRGQGQARARAVEKERTQCMTKTATDKNGEKIYEVDNGYDE